MGQAVARLRHDESRLKPGTRFLPSAILALGILSACANQPGSPEEAPAPSQVLAGYQLPYIPPPGPDRLRTTDPAIFISNLDARIETMRERLARSASDSLRMQLATNLLQRYEILGQGADFEAARDLAAAVAEDAPQRADALLLLARMDTAIHHFDAARKRIEQAQRLGADAPRTALLQATAAWGSGDPHALRAAPVDSDRPEALAFEANRLVEQGHPQRALLMLVDAQRRYRDTNPLPLAWLQVQQGIVYLRYQQLEAARALFQSAHERLPKYFLATEHLAETELALGNASRAAELYRQVAAQTDDPLFYAALAEAEAALGNAEAERLARQRAVRGFERQLAQTPEAAYAHAAGFHLDQEDAPRAYALAVTNAEHRSDPSSLLLLVETAAATQRFDEACHQLERVTAMGVRSPEALLLAAQLEPRC